MSFWQIRIFASTYLCYAGYYFCRKPFFIAKADVGQALSLGARELGIIGSVYLIAYTAGQFVSAWSGDRIGPRRLLISGMLLSIVSNIAFGATNSYATFLIFMGLNGLAQSTGWSGGVGAMAPWFTRHERGRVMAAWATNFQAGGVLANALAAFALARFGYRYSFLLGSCVLFAVYLFFLFNQRNRPEDVGLPPVSDPLEGEQPANETGEPGAGKAESSFGGLSRGQWASILLLGCAYFFIKFIRYTLWSWAPYVLRKNYAQAGDTAGYVSTLFDLFGIAGVLTAGYLSDRWFNGRRAVISLIFLSGMTLSALWLRLAADHNLIVFAICMALIGFMLYGPDALLTGAGAIDLGSVRHATLAAGIINGMGAFGPVVQDILIGDLYERFGGELGPIFALLLGSAFFSTLVLAVVVLRNRSHASDV